MEAEEEYSATQIQEALQVLAVTGPSKAVPETKEQRRMHERWAKYELKEQARGLSRAQAQRQGLHHRVLATPDSGASAPPPTSLAVALAPPSPEPGALQAPPSYAGNVLGQGPSRNTFGTGLSALQATSE
eukprot:9807657-Alexandrium_andersonii.AAC.1